MTDWIGADVGALLSHHKIVECWNDECDEGKRAKAFTDDLHRLLAERGWVGPQAASDAEKELSRAEVSSDAWQHLHAGLIAAIAAAIGEPVLSALPPSNQHENALQRVKALVDEADHWRAKAKRYKKQRDKARAQVPEETGGQADG